MRTPQSGSKRRTVGENFSKLVFLSQDCTGHLGATSYGMQLRPKSGSKPSPERSKLPLAGTHHCTTRSTRAADRGEGGREARAAPDKWGRLTFGGRRGGGGGGAVEPEPGGSPSAPQQPRPSSGRGRERPSGRWRVAASFASADGRGGREAGGGLGRGRRGEGKVRERARRGGLACFVFRATLHQQGVRWK